MTKPPDWCKKLRDCEVRCDNCPESEMTDKCPSCEYNKLRAEMWRQEAYNQSGTPLRGRELMRPREWKALTEAEIQTAIISNGLTVIDQETINGFCEYLSYRLKEKNT